MALRLLRRVLRLLSHPGRGTRGHFSCIYRVALQPLRGRFPRQFSKISFKLCKDQRSINLEQRNILRLKALLPSFWERFKDFLGINTPRRSRNSLRLFFLFVFFHPGIDSRLSAALDSSAEGFKLVVKGFLKIFLIKKDL